ncbi:pyridoxamine 5'-phosphate oxidase family protein [Streptomyces apocyni]|uniref:pyridoxamine 5'-phosphate oxidase family protein n=1 Tax=Streptomyces apocyni TaxID=2654677 RepID=UPI0012EA385A|nr:pyridoxamine 5'-phosphate oxidase family protein [Streptomyces apocyni]
MTNLEPARSREQRIHDVRERLEKDVDVWVSTASADGGPVLVPLSFVWDDGALIMSTKRVNATARNLTPGGPVMLSLGHTRDVVLIEATTTVIEGTELPTASADAFARQAGFDPRDREAWIYLRAVPQVIRTWREENELAGRVVMRDGAWLG